MNYFFEVVLNASVTDCAAWSRHFWLYLILKFLFIFLPIFLPIFLAKDKNSVLKNTANSNIFHFNAANTTTDPFKIKGKITVETGHNDATATAQGDDYLTGCLLNYNYFKNYLR